MKKFAPLITAGLGCLAAWSAAEANPGFAGEWVTDSDLSSALDPFSRIELNIAVDGTEIHIEETYTTGRRRNTNTYTLDTAVDVNVVPIDWWADNRHIGAFIGGDKTVLIRADWVDNGETLRLQSDFILQTSQGETPVRATSEYRLSRNGERLTRIDLRSSRNLPVVRVFKRR